MQHFDYFIKLDNLVKKSLIIYKSKSQVEGAYVHDESEFKLLSEYFAIGKTYAGRIEIANNYFRGECGFHFTDITYCDFSTRKFFS